MTLVVRSIAALAIAFSLALSIGCGKKAEEDADAKASKLAGAADVMAALDKKDFQGAVGALVKVKATVTPAQKRAYADLLDKVKESMILAMGTNDSAKEAFQALRYVETGR